MQQLQQTWDNSHFFSGSGDPQIERTVQALKGDIHELATACTLFTPLLESAETLSERDVLALIAQIKIIYQQRLRVLEQWRNLSTFISCVLSVDAQDANANTWLPTLQQLGADLDQAMKPLHIFLMRVRDEFIIGLVAEMPELEFSLRCDRKLKDQLLNVAAEKLLSGLSVNGLHSWGNLYRELAGTLTCEWAGEAIGLAQAANLLSDPIRETRETIWKGIQAAWTSRQETVATILNAINGWRLEEMKQRAHHRELNYLDKSCHQNRIERPTLEALMSTTYAHREIGQRALKAMAKAQGLSRLAPWDLMAAAPSLGDPQVFSFEAAIDLIANAFSQFNPEMGDFVIRMAENGWIDSQPTPHRATGAYCTQFTQPREPRIFTTFAGSMSSVTTLAHELGHAWHNWVMRDQPLLQTSYPMTLAETASIFAETLVRDALLQQAQDRAQKLAILWQDAESAAVFLLNIPARFEFEKRLVESRETGFVVPEKLKAMMAESWQMWYEDSLSEYEPMFWASKLHFSISQVGFYNYPYLFGYLFSLGIYAQRDQYGEAFNGMYTNILKDTGRMTSEELVQQHLQQDIRAASFWERSLAIVENAVNQFEQLVA